jgi:hypothetical protein
MCSLDKLLADLDNEDTSVALDAQISLEDRGEEAIKPILSLLPSLDFYGQSCALDLLSSWSISLLEAQHNPSVSEVLIPLIRSQSSYVRQWSTYVLGSLGTKEAIPEIEQALKKVKAEGIPLDYTEPVAYRRTLTQLGARTEIVLDRMVLQQQHFKNCGFCWPATLLIECIESLSSQSQVLLYYQAWQKRGNSYYWQETPQYEIDLTGSWNDTVIRSAACAIDTVSKWVPPKNAVVTLEWIGEKDL